MKLNRRSLVIASLVLALTANKHVAANETPIVLLPEDQAEHGEFLRHLAATRSIISRREAQTQAAVDVFTCRSVGPERLNIRRLVLVGAESPTVAISVPTLILHGTDDDITPVANAQRLADAIPGSWLIRLPSGHDVHNQLPELTAALVDLFLRQDA